MGREFGKVPQSLPPLKPFSKYIKHLPYSPLRFISWEKYIKNHSQRKMVTHFCNKINTIN